MAITLVICKNIPIIKQNLHTITSKQYAAESLQKLSKGHNFSLMGCKL